MIKITTNRLYINAKDAWTEQEEGKQYINSRQWRHAFEYWLNKQGAEIDHCDRGVVATDEFGVAPGEDHLTFENEHLATMFVLKWS
jgi:hypothetical protein